MLCSTASTRPVHSKTAVKNLEMTKPVCQKEQYAKGGLQGNSVVGCHRAEKEAARLGKEAEKERVKQEKEAARKEKEVSSLSAGQHSDNTSRLLSCSSLQCMSAAVVLPAQGALA